MIFKKMKMRIFGSLKRRKKTITRQPKEGIVLKEEIVLNHSHTPQNKKELMSKLRRKQLNPKRKENK